MSHRQRFDELVIKEELVYHDEEVDNQDVESLNGGMQD